MLRFRPFWRDWTFWFTVLAPFSLYLGFIHFIGGWVAPLLILSFAWLVVPKWSRFMLNWKSRREIAAELQLLRAEYDRLVRDYDLVPADQRWRRDAQLSIVRAKLGLLQEYAEKVA